MPIPTVSKIISYSRSPESQERLSIWKKNNPRKSTQNKKRGNNLHKLVELYVKGDLLDPEDTGNNYFDMLLPFLESFTPVQAEVEIPVTYTSNNTPYKGRIDVLFDDCLVEVKTASKPPHHKSMEEYRLQLGAYSLALNDMGLKVNKSLLVLCYPDKSPSIIEGNIPIFQNNFSHILNNYYANVNRTIKAQG